MQDGKRLQSEQKDKGDLKTKRAVHCPDQLGRQKCFLTLEIKIYINKWRN